MIFLVLLDFSSSSAVPSVGLVSVVLAGLFSLGSLGFSAGLGLSKLSINIPSTIVVPTKLPASAYSCKNCPKKSFHSPQLHGFGDIIPRPTIFFCSKRPLLIVEVEHLLFLKLRIMGLVEFKL